CAKRALTTKYTHTGKESDCRMAAEEAQNRGGKRWSLTGMTALVTGGTRGIGFSSFSFSLNICIINYSE
ncbi:hypothetical protein A2U01_0050928, partial [Trifolium medium]|nr:hypothetical protein [Trifolium medium]